jgi:ribosomal protein S18 acetylase RimI-like enzyme
MSAELRLLESEEVGWCRYAYEVGGVQLGELKLEWRRDDLVGVWSVRIEEAHRSKGHGRRMMGLAVNRARGREMYLWVAKDNVVALKLYRSMGFVEREHHKEYLRSENVIWMKYPSLLESTSRKHAAA